MPPKKKNTVEGNEEIIETVETTEVETETVETAEESPIVPEPPREPITSATSTKTAIELIIDEVTSYEEAAPPVPTKADVAGVVQIQGSVLHPDLQNHSK